MIYKFIEGDSKDRQTNRLTVSQTERETFNVDFKVYAQKTQSKNCQLNNFIELY